MSPLWALSVILLILTVLFVILPSIFKRDNVAVTTHRVTTTAHSVQQHAENASCDGNTTAQEKERCMDRDMLKSFYPPPLTKETPIDYPKKAIGACPYSKPQSKALPLADVPMHMI